MNLVSLLTVFRSNQKSKGHEILPTFRKSQPFQHIGLWNFDNVNIFWQKMCTKKCSLNIHIFFAHVLDKNTTFVKNWERR